MPTYQYLCDNCRTYEERYIELADFDTLAHAQRCSECEGTLRKIFSVPSLVTDTALMVGSDDGFGADNRSRMIARQKAAKAGVNIAGAKFHPGLCRRGVMFDPQAWYRSREEVAKRADALERNVDGIITHRTPIRDKHYKTQEEPYRVSADCVKEEVAMENKHRYGGNATPAQLDSITQKLVEHHSGTPANKGPVKIRPTR